MSHQVHVIPSSDPFGIDSTTWGSIAAGLLLLVFLSQRLYDWTGPAQSFLETLWNIFVRAVPARLVLGRIGVTSIDSASGGSASQRRASIHTAKSDVLRSAFRLDRLASNAHEKAQSLIPKGLGNWDNSCYQNSVLQSMSSLRSFQGFLQWTVTSHLTNGQKTTTKALHDLIVDLNSGTSASRYIWTPALLKSMDSWQQQDAQEYFSKIVDAVEKEVASALNKQRIEAGQTAFNASAQSSTNETIPTASPQFHPFEGYLAQRVGCTQCGYTEGLSLIPFTCVTLPLDRSYASTLEWSLDKFCELETIQGVECIKCTLLRQDTELRMRLEVAGKNDIQANDDVTKDTLKEWLQATEDALATESYDTKGLLKRCGVSDSQKVSANKTRQGAFIRAPQCLVLHLNRSMFDEMTFQQLKNYTEVAYPERLDLGRWTLGAAADANRVEAWPLNPMQPMLDIYSTTVGVTYELRAVVNHQGRHENGHYVAVRKVDADSSLKTLADREDVATRVNWWRISDEKVVPADEQEALSQGGAFMLFYEQTTQDLSRSNLDQGQLEAPESELAASTTSAISDTISEPSEKVSSRTDSESSWTEVTVESGTSRTGDKRSTEPRKMPD